MELTAKGPLPPLAEILYIAYNHKIKAIAELNQLKSDLADAVDGGDTAAAAKTEDLDTDLDATQAILKEVEKKLKDTLLDFAKESTTATAHQIKSNESENGKKSQPPAEDPKVVSPAGTHGAESSAELDPG